MAFALAMPASGQEAGKVYRIGYLAFVSLPDRHHDAFRQGLRGLGYVEGRNIEIVARSAERIRARLSELAAEMVAAKPDVIVVNTGSTALALKRVTARIPVVMTGSSDAVAMGIAASLSRPGANVTGFTIISPDLAPKRLELLAALPGMKRIAALWCPVAPINQEELRRLSAAAKRLGVALDPMEYRQTSTGWDSLAAAIARSRPDGLLLLDCTSLPFDELEKFAAEQRLPLISPYGFRADRGALLAYSADTVQLARRAAAYVDKILKGADPREMPIEQPTEFEFAINLKVARAMGLKLPSSLLARATRVIE